VIIATEWNQFRNLDLLRVRAALNQPVLVDLRNVCDPSEMADQGFRYSAIGR
jgi:UDPglucose 6-dehydrogenase